MLRWGAPQAMQLRFGDAMSYRAMVAHGKSSANKIRTCARNGETIVIRNAKTFGVCVSCLPQGIHIGAATRFAGGLPPS